MKIDTAERLAQLIVGAVCIFALIASGVMEGLYPGFALSDRVFWVLFVIGASALGLEKALDMLRAFATAFATAEFDNSGDLESIREAQERADRQYRDRERQRDRQDTHSPRRGNDDRDRDREA